MRKTTSQLAATVISMAGVAGMGSSALAGDQLLWWGSDGVTWFDTWSIYNESRWKIAQQLDSGGMSAGITRPPANLYESIYEIALHEAMGSASTLAIGEASDSEADVIVESPGNTRDTDTIDVVDQLPVLYTLAVSRAHDFAFSPLPTAIEARVRTGHYVVAKAMVATGIASAAVEYAFFIEPLQESIGSTRSVDGSGNVFLGTPDIGASSVDGWGAVGRVAVQSGGNHNLISSQSASLEFSTQNEAAFFTVRQSPSVVVSVPTEAQSTLAVLVGPGSTLTFQEAVTGAADLRKDGAGSMEVGEASIAGRVDVIEGTLAVSSMLRSTALAIWAQGSEDGVLGDAPVRPVLDLSQPSARVIVDYTTADPALLSLDAPMYNPSALVARIKGAYDDGDWSGTPVVPGLTALDGIFTSSAAAASVGGSDQLGIGYGESSTVLGSSGGQFGDEQVDGTAALFMVTLRGDTNLDGDVDFPDLLKLYQSYNSAGQWVNGDFDYSGMVDFGDLVALQQNYGGSLLQSGSIEIDTRLRDQFHFDLALARSMVPEPTVGMFVIGMVGIAGRRAREAR